MRALPGEFREYEWAPSTAEIARRAGIAPEQVLRFDGNTPPRPPRTARPDVVARELERINVYAHGGFPEITAAIAEYAGVAPENVVLGAGADDLILLVARAYAAPGDRVAIAYQPSYPLYRLAAWFAGAEVGHADAVLTFCCRPHNPTGALVELPDARPLVVDEAYFEYAGGDSAVALLDDEVIVLRTFSKAFGLASARIGYALARADVAAQLRARHAPAPVSTLSIALALAGLADPPDVTETIAERERLAAELRARGLEPTPSHANFVHVPVEGARELYETLLGRGLAVRPAPGAIRITVRDRRDDDVLLAALAELR